MHWKICFLLLPLVNGARALTCLQCKGISQPRRCTIVDECYQGEVCGVEKVTNTLGHTVYNVGCITHSKCLNEKLTHHGSISERCLDCCSTDLCNSQGCGEPGYPQNRGPICYRCPLHTSLGTCNDIAFCEPGDVCKYVVLKEFGDLVHTSECSSAHECNHGYQHGTAIVGRDVTSIREQNNPLLVRRRSLIEHVCSGCCDKDLCNKGCNGTTRILDYCSSSPCLHGRCVNTVNGFTCVCDHMYTGVTCNSLTDFCESNPCQNGSCLSNGNSYTCICSAGFGGLNCEKVMTDCFDVFHHGGITTDGIYIIITWKTHQKIKVYCDMTTADGGWTVIQHRFNKSVDFYRNFSEYENGFGDLKSEFWLGLKYIQEIASQGTAYLRADVEATNGTTAYETFNMFKLSPRPAYRLSLGDTISSLRISDINRFGRRANGSAFSTFDNDVDTSVDNCASDYEGGWWYDDCFGIDLNGRIIYYHGFIFNGHLKSSKMMIKRK